VQRPHILEELGPVLLISSVVGMSLSITVLHDLNHLVEAVVERSLAVVALVSEVDHPGLKIGAGLVLAIAPVAQEGVDLGVNVAEVASRFGEIADLILVDGGEVVEVSGQGG
jgi:hypothetical protein